MPHFEAERQIEAAQIDQRLQEILDTLYVNRRAIPKVEIAVTGKGKGPEAPPKKGWKAFPVKDNPRWGGYDQTTWFRMNVTVPAAMKGRPVVALIRTSMTSFALGMEGLSQGAEALAYVNGEPFQGLDFNRDELLLTPKARGGEKFSIVLEAVPSTRYDVYHHFKYADVAVKRMDVWNFYWDAAVALAHMRALDANFAPRQRIHELLMQAMLMVDMQHKGEGPYYTSLAKAQRFLRSGLKEFAESHGMGKLTLTGHAHIDTAWLWPLRETRRKCSRTFSTVLKLMELYPEFKFSCSQPIQYAWIKDDHPSLYERIKQRIKEGRWECCGAPWIEPDCNVPSGESLVRQFLYGNRFFEKEFGLRSLLAWQPDAFGYAWQLPQIMRKIGLKAFVTTKIDWNQYTRFPYSYFMWEGADGTRIPTIMPPLNYNGNPVPEDLIKQWDLFQQKDCVDELPFPFGWGDGGGGPTMAMIEHGKRLKNMIGVPRVEFGRNDECIDRMLATTDENALPVYNGELYLELHRGCQTTQARTKRNNRKSEIALRDAEFLGALALLNGGEYDQAHLEEAWKIVLTNQFHDILPGSSITEVYTQADKDYAHAWELIAKARHRHLRGLLPTIDTSGKGTPIVVFNTLSWMRGGAARVQTPLPRSEFSVVGPDGAAVPYQRIGHNELLFETQAVPPLGFAVYHIVTGEELDTEPGMLKISRTSLENEYLRLRVNTRGELVSVFDKMEQREVLSHGERGNVLQLFDDRPYLHDAWDIDHNVDEVMWEPGPAEQLEIIEEGPVRAVLRVVRRTEKSTITQDITLYADTPRVDFVTSVEWWEKRTLLKVAFPVDVRASSATYEIQYGAIERPTHTNTAFDKARHEVAGHRWADLSEGDYGVSLLNDCKYGWDIKGNVMRLSLLRSSIDPDPYADEGHHEFTYSLYPHAWSWRNGAVHQGMELNTPLIAVEDAKHEGRAPNVGTFACVDVDNVIIDSVKKAEDSDDIIVRVYEAYGQRGEANIIFARKPKRAVECDLMEEHDRKAPLKGNTVTLFVKPYEIRTLKLRF